MQNEPPSWKHQDAGKQEQNKQRSKTTTVNKINYTITAYIQ